MNKLKIVLLLGVLLLMAALTERVSAQSLEGVWEGHVLSVNRTGKIPANAAFDWGKNRWGLTLPANSWASYDAKLDISGTYRNLKGNYSADDKNNPKNSGHYAFTGNFNFDQKLMVWQPQQKIGGQADYAKTIIRSLTYSYEDGDEFEYLKGRWAAPDGGTGIMEFRRKYSGTPLKDDNVESDFALVETGDQVYTIKKDDFYLALNDDKSGILSKKDAGEEARKWKFEAAPSQFTKAFRIVPVGKDDHCLKADDSDDGSVSLVEKTDSPEGEQYWRFERSGGGVILVNVKLGGRGIYINDEDSGQTILRSRNEAQHAEWKLEKE